ncbi:hypothetical protein J6590_085898 [Homalodisca vitripennis]|nr:hypothetical protein J6590_085898 [Homalodisca vitripennis]
MKLSGQMVDDTRIITEHDGPDHIYIACLTTRRPRPHLYRGECGQMMDDACSVSHHDGPDHIYIAVSAGR